MGAQVCRVSNLQRRPVVIRGRSGTSFHLAPLESGREIRAVELAGNRVVDKLKRRRILSVEDVSASSKPVHKTAPARKSRKRRG